MLTKLDFDIDWPTLKEDYYSQKNAALRKWFEVIAFDLREQIKKVWIADMERLHVSISFLLWFPTFASKYGLPEVYSQPSLNVQTTLMKVERERERERESRNFNSQRTHKETEPTDTQRNRYNKHTEDRRFRRIPARVTHRSLGPCFASRRTPAGHCLCVQKAPK